jgi:hypothetical protein
VAPRATAGTVAQAMQAAFAGVGVTSTARVLAADNTGLTVE